MIKTLIKSPEELGLREQELLWVLIDDISRGQFCKLYKKVLITYFDPVIITLRKLLSVCLCVYVYIIKMSLNYIDWIIFTDISNRSLFLIVLETGKYKSKALAGMVSDESLLPAS